MAVQRAKVMQMMRAAVRKGQSRTAFLKTVRAKGLQYPQKRMYTDWSHTTEFVAKEGMLIHVRRDSYPSSKTLIETDWDIDGEYMFTVKVTSRLKPTEPLKEHFVNIVTNQNMTPEMIEQTVTEKWGSFQDSGGEVLETVIPWTAIHTNI